MKRRTLLLVLFWEIDFLVFLCAFLPVGYVLHNTFLIMPWIHLALTIWAVLTLCLALLTLLWRRGSRSGTTHG